MPKHKEAVEDESVAVAVIEEDMEIAKAIVQEAIDSKELYAIFPPRVGDRVIFTDNYPQGYGKKLAAIIMDVSIDRKADLATFDKTQNPICHPRPGIAYDINGTPGTWRYPDE